MSQQNAHPQDPRIPVEFSPKDPELPDPRKPWVHGPWDPLAYMVLLHRILDGGLKGLTGPSQRVWLQIIRETWGRGAGTIEITQRTLAHRTGLQLSTVHRALQVLQHKGWLELVDPPRGPLPARYHPLFPTHGLDKSAPLDAATPLSIASRLEDLLPEDRKLLDALEAGLSPPDRQAMKEEVQTHFNDLGIRPTEPLFQQALRYHIFISRMAYHRIRSRYPHWFPRHSTGS